MRDYLGLSSTDSSQEDYGLLESLKIPALGVVILLVILTIIFYFLNLSISYEPENLSFSLNLVFIGLPSFFIAFIAARSFMRTGAWPILWLGIGTLTFGLATVIGSFLIDRSTINGVITIHNSIAFISAIFFTVGAIFTLQRVVNVENKSRRSKILLIYFAVLILIFFIVMISLQGILPPFFIQGVGGTFLRQTLLAIGAFLFLLAGLINFREYFKSKSLILYWYSLALLLMSLGMIGIMMQSSLGTPLNWMGRGAQLLGGVYLLVTALVILKTARTMDIAADEALASFFKTHKSDLNILLDSVTDAIISCDHNFNITGWNNAAENIYGWKAEEAIGKPLDLLQTNYPVEINKNDVNILIEDGDWSGEVIQKHKDGREIPILTSSSGLRDERGKFKGSITINRDISERKKVENELKKSESKYHSLYSTMSEGVAIHDVVYNKHHEAVDYIITDVNPAYETILGLEKGDVIGNKGSKLYGTGNPPFLEIYASVAEGGEVQQFENYFEPMDKYFRISVSSPQKGKFATFFEDITKRKRDEEILNQTLEELKRSNKELKQFAYVASHDLQEPLRMVSSFSRLLERRYKGELDSDADEFIDFIVDGAQRMKQLIDDLLAYSRVTSQAKEFVNVDLETIINVVLSNLAVSIEENNVVVSHDPLPNVFADPSQMVQVFQNLISNSIKFRGQKTPEIHISADNNEKEWKFAVSDNGIGIEPKHQKQIFEVFKRLHTREEYPGSGIGLSICQKIVERHGGRIWVESEPEKGSTFYFTIKK